MKLKLFISLATPSVILTTLVALKTITLVESAPSSPTLNHQSQQLRQTSSLSFNPQPWSSREGPRVYITPQRPNFVVDSSTPSTKTLTCQTDGDVPHMFGQLRWTGPDKTDNFDELAKRHKVSEETKNSNVWELEFREPSVDDSGIYYCFGTYLTSNTFNASIKVEVTNPIRIENCPEKQWIKLDSDDARVTCRITADMPRVQIFKDGQQIEGSNQRYKHQDDSILINGRVQPSDAGKYMFRVKSTTGDKREQIIDVQVHSKPEVVPNNGTQGGEYFTAVEGQQAQLKCDAIGNPHPLVYWIDPRQRNLTSQGGYIVNQERGLLTIQRVNKFDDHGSFKCVAYNDVSDSATASVFLNVDVPPEITNFDNQTVDEGQLVTFECRSKGDPRPRFSIRRYGMNQIAYENGDPYQLDSIVQPEGGRSPVHVYRAKLRANRTIFGLHYCNATNKAGTAERVAQLMVRFKPDLSATPPEQLTKYGNNLAVKCHIQAYPSPTVSFWTDNTQIINAELDAQRSPDGQTHVASLTLPPNIAYNKITCKASNDLGEVTKDIYPRYTTRPGPVYDERVQLLPTSVRLRLFVRNDGGDKIKGYKYTLAGNSRILQDPFYKYPRDIRNETLLDASPFPDAVYTIKNLYPNYGYQMRIRAFNEAGDGDISDISFETLKSTRPDPPIIIDQGTPSSHQPSSRISDYQDGYLLRWSPPDTDNGDPIRKYIISYKRIDGGTSSMMFGNYPIIEIEQLNDRPFTARLGPLEPNANYKISVIASNSLGDSDPAQIEVFTSPQRPPMPEFSSSLLTTVLIAAIIVTILIDLTFCFCFQMGVSHVVHEKGVRTLYTRA